MVIKKLLERELNWKNWIKASCPPFEKFPIKKSEEILSSDDQPVKGSKMIIFFSIIIVFVFIHIMIHFLSDFFLLSFTNIIRCFFFFVNFILLFWICLFLFNLPTHWITHLIALTISYSVLGSFYCYFTLVTFIISHSCKSFLFLFITSIIFNFFVTCLQLLSSFLLFFFCLGKRSLSAPLDASSSMGKKMKKAKIQKVDYHTQQNDEIMVTTTLT